MPVVRRDVVKSPPQQRPLLQAVHAALEEALRTPEDDRTELLVAS